ncbi:MAG: hypothetical protein ACRD9Y_10630 [Blastocatellia bacterium]
MTGRKIRPQARLAAIFLPDIFLLFPNCTFRFLKAIDAAVSCNDRKALMFYQNQSNRERPAATRTRLPLPVATGGIGLFIAAVSPGGLSGGSGFLIGFLVGLLFPALVAVLSEKSHSAQIGLSANVETLF